MLPAAPQGALVRRVGLTEVRASVAGDARLGDVAKRTVALRVGAERVRDAVVRVRVRVRVVRTGAESNSSCESIGVVLIVRFLVGVVAVAIELTPILVGTVDCRAGLDPGLIDVDARHVTASLGWVRGGFSAPMLSSSNARPRNRQPCPVAPPAALSVTVTWTDWLLFHAPATCVANCGWACPMRKPEVNVAVCTMVGS